MTEGETKVIAVEDYLNRVSYAVDPNYVPSDFALEFINFIKLVNGVKGEEHASPVVHFQMLDQIVGPMANIANMCARGTAKTSVMGEYLFLYLAVYGKLPNFGRVNYALYVSDSIENGVKKMRLRLERRRENSEFLMHYVPNVRFTDIRWYFKNRDGNEFVVSSHGAKALALDSTLYTDTGTTTIGECCVGDLVYGPDGKSTRILAKSEIFNKPMYVIRLSDGREIKVSEDHLNSVQKYGIPRVLTTLEILDSPIYHTAPNGTKRFTYQIVNTEPVEFSEKHFPIDPYTLGLLLGDGSMKSDGSNILHAHREDMMHYLHNIPYLKGKQYLDLRNDNVLSIGLLNIYSEMEEIGLRGCSMATKHIPEVYFTGSADQRLSVLQGLLDTDGTISGEGKVSFCSTSPQLIADIIRLVRSLGGTAKRWKATQVEKQHSVSWKVGIWLNARLFRLPRKQLRQHGFKSCNVSIINVCRIADEPSQCIAVDNQSKEFLTNDYTRTHNTGVRGTVELNTRPQLAILDDLLSDEDARSATVIGSIEDTVYKAIDYALHPTHQKIIWSGTPFNARDPLYKAVESGAWAVNVFPICEKFPCTKEEFSSIWPDRFPYEYVKGKYDKAMKMGKINTFNQELMLRIISEEERLILDDEIGWYKRNHVLMNKGRFNFYITTDFAVEEKQHNDFSVISVWALNNKGYWFWVDGICKRQLMNKNIDDLFRLAQMYKPQQVGVEVSGQQTGFISWIEEQMLVRNIYFTLASEGNKGKAGIRPNTNKMVRFNIVLPYFKTHQIFFPVEMKQNAIMIELINELSLATHMGFKSKKDDFIDTISMLGSLTTWKPSEEFNVSINSDSIWEMEAEEETVSGLGSYIV